MVAKKILPQRRTGIPLQTCSLREPQGTDFFVVAKKLYPNKEPALLCHKLPSRASGSGWGRGTSLSLHQLTRDWRGGRKPVAKGNGVGRAPRNPGKPVIKDLDAELADACPVFKRKHVQKKTKIKNIWQKVNHVRIIEFNQKY